jgi:hypothetical protein
MGINITLINRLILLIIGALFMQTLPATFTEYLFFLKAYL